MQKMTLSEELEWRGLLNQTTFKELSKLDTTKHKFYHGFDASADSLTIGNLAGIMLDKCFLRHGNHGVILAGGATSLIGDPGGKDSERPLQTVELIEANVAKIRKQLDKLLGSETELANNLDWFKNLNTLTFLRDVGKHFSMTPLVQRDYIAKRIGNEGAGISYTEFSYTIMQGYDFLQLYENYDVNMQLAGSDQWGNCLSGVELIRKIHNKTVNVLTCPLIINRQTGKKFGKSEEGAVWLDPTKTTPLKFYQFWINVSDDSVEELLKIFTELDKSQVDKIIKKHFESPALRGAQTALAKSVTGLVHGKRATETAALITDILTNKIDLPEDDEALLELIRIELPSLQIKRATPLVEVLVKTGLASSKGDANRLIVSGAIYVNGENFKEPTVKSEIFNNKKLLIRRGKAFKDTALVELV